MSDVSKKKEVVKILKEVVSKLDKIDVLVNNAGILSFEPFLKMNQETWDKMMAVNLGGQFLVAQAVAKQMVEKKIAGRIINIAPIASG